MSLAAKPQPLVHAWVALGSSAAHPGLHLGPCVHVQHVHGPLRSCCARTVHEFWFTLQPIHLVVVQHRPIVGKVPLKEQRLANNCAPQVHRAVPLHFELWAAALGGTAPPACRLLPWRLPLLPACVCEVSRQGGVAPRASKRRQCVLLPCRQQVACFLHQALPDCGSAPARMICIARIRFFVLAFCYLPTLAQKYTFRRSKCRQKPLEKLGGEAPEPNFRWVLWVLGRSTTAWSVAAVWRSGPYGTALVQAGKFVLIAPQESEQRASAVKATTCLARLNPAASASRPCLPAIWLTGCCQQWRGLCGCTRKRWVHRREVAGWHGAGSFPVSWPAGCR